MTQFKFPQNLADHLENEIYNKLIASVQTDVDKYNSMWAKREQAGKTYDTHKVYKSMYNKVVEEKVYYYQLSKGLLSITIPYAKDRAPKQLVIK